MGFWSAVVVIVIVTAIAGTLRTIITRNAPGHAALAGPEVHHLTREVQVRRDRVAVLERIATDRNHALEHEIERLRDR